MDLPEQPANWVGQLLQSQWEDQFGWVTAAEIDSPLHRELDSEQAPD